MHPTRRVFATALISALLFSATTPAFAGIIEGFVDSSDGGGMIATQEWDDDGATLFYSVQKSNADWKYSYSWRGLDKDLSHIIFQVSDTFTADNILEGTTGGYELSEFGDTQGNSNPGIPDALYGIKFDMSTDATDALVTIVSNRAPMWGSFYAKSGNSGGSSVYAYNSNFGGTSVAPISGTADGLVLVPDTRTTIPLPATMILLLVGLAGILGSNRVLTRTNA
jgi:hypothetical protein